MLGNSVITPEEYIALTGRDLPDEIIEELKKKEKERGKSSEPHSNRYSIVLDGFQNGQGLLRLEAVATEAGRERVRRYLAAINERNGLQGRLTERII